MSENTKPQAAEETPQAQLTEGELEQVAGGTDVGQTIINGVNTAIKLVTQPFLT